MSSSGRVSFRIVTPLSGIGPEPTVSSRYIDAKFTPIPAPRHAISVAAAPFLV